ncbi:sulfotransferase family 2 domain-containing protein [Pseudophaeobacter flagellatus]|uniref:sulfotransferase family 2 domain-containing protein n=1 Tax=Pseudophaeobacter flagellatus TaxID=2899119 RepID=UPI001E56E814|nr:sulfotransferase family 2 domain-containing protein [Pseudophaeobacter flagellatus]MCD9146984.1 sulfotransferase family protein [Pseudophaeobacter flagellatus]
MTDLFDYFVVFAEMRTGSNFLETNLNAITGVSCHGEAFNPHFIGYPNRDDLLGVTQEMREQDPGALLSRIKGSATAGGLAGFRYFHDHDPRILDLALEDPRCAKIILTRNPLESYVSWKIARATGQWKLTDVKRRKEAQARFDSAEFSQHVADLQAFQVTLLNRLQKSGQSAFYLAYEDLQSLEVMNGLAQWLGMSGRLEALDASLKPQNPAPLRSKVENPTEMAAALAEMDHFNLGRSPNFEPRRGPAVPSYVAGAVTPLLYLPIKGGPEAEVTAWMAQLDQGAGEELQSRMNQKQLRHWKRHHPGFRSFTVLRHPAARVHAAFCRRVLAKGGESYGNIRETLRRQFKLPLPKGGPDVSYSVADHRAAFSQFLTFLQANLAGQTSIRVDADWASQSQALLGLAELGAPDLVLREEELGEALPALAQRLGSASPGRPQRAAADQPYPLAAIWDAALEKQVSSLYQRDYMMFGFAPWVAGPEG